VHNGQQKPNLNAFEVACSVVICGFFRGLKAPRGHFGDYGVDISSLGFGLMKRVALHAVYTWLNESR